MLKEFIDLPLTDADEFKVPELPVFPARNYLLIIPQPR